MTEATEEFTWQIAVEARRAVLRREKAHNLINTLELLVQSANEELATADVVANEWLRAAASAGADPRTTQVPRLPRTPGDALPEITRIIRDLENAYEGAP